MIITRTPFRISFFGGGTDYPAWYEKNGGAVLGTAIDKYCYVTCRTLPPFFEHKSRIVWSEVEKVNAIDEIKHPAVKGALSWLKIDDGVEIFHNADLPARSGLGSSSAFSVGLLHALYALKGEMVTKRKLALDAIHLEQKILKENVGSQDQTAAAFGGFNKIEFGGPEEIKIVPVYLNPAVRQELQNHLMLFFTGLTRTASDVAKEQIKKTEEGAEETKRRLSRMAETVDEAIDILRKEDFREFGSLLHEAWQMKRGLTDRISNDRIDEMYKAGREAGALGGKLLGAGGGGFMLFFVPPERQKSVREKLKDLVYVPVGFDTAGSHIIYYSTDGDHWKNGRELHTL